MSVFTHEDGTVSVGISGRTEASARFAKQLEDSLNKDGRQKYKVLGLATEKFKGYLKDSLCAVRFLGGYLLFLLSSSVYFLVK